MINLAWFGLFNKVIWPINWWLLETQNTEKGIIQNIFAICSVQTYISNTRGKHVGPFTYGPSELIGQFHSRKFMGVV